MAPRGELPHAAGTTATCTFQGFVVTMGMVYFATAYTQLAMLYWLITKHSWTKDYMAKAKIRAIFLLPPIVASLGFAMPGLFLESYNPGLCFCFLNEYPPNCENDPTVECTRGADAFIVRDVAFAYMLGANIIVVVFMGLLICVVYNQEKTGDKYLSPGQKINRQHTIDCAWQGVRFSLAYTAAYTVLYVIVGYDAAEDATEQGFDVAYEHKDMPAHAIALTYALVILTPMMGFFNALVYFYPRYVLCRKQNADKSRCYCLCDTLGIDIRCRGKVRPGWSVDQPIIIDDSDTESPLISDT
ncbi:hypothetical protein ACHAWF_006549 [Thalassiosira exigua]